MKNYISEFIGTFAMIFCGTGAMAINEVTGGDVTHVGIGITWGLIVMAMIYAFGEYQELILIRQYLLHLLMQKSFLGKKFQSIYFSR